MKLRMIALVLLLSPTLGAQNLAEDVLKGKEITGIEFKNYVGPHALIESRLAIQGIGAELGNQIKANPVSANYGGKYRIQRVYDPTSPLVSADLFILEATAGVDHIRNLNWILSSYLQQAFGYSVSEGDLLADFVTRYNAYYRGKTAYYPGVYSPMVVAALVPPESAGISLDYRDWAGKTIMLIPLRSSLSKGAAGSVNTEEISNKEIVKDMGTTAPALESRKELANLKEAEIVQEQKTIAQKEAQLTAPTAGNPPTDTQPPADTTPGKTAGAATSAAATNAAGSASAGSTAAGSASAGPGAASSSTTTTPAALAAAKNELAQRDAALQAERKDIVAATTKTPEPAVVVPVVKPASTTAVVSVQETTKLGQVVLIDPTTNKIWKRSDLNTVRQGRVQVFGDGLLVTAGDTKGSNGAVRLLILNKEDLSIALTSADDVSADTPVLIQGNQLLTLTKTDKGLWVVGLFDSKLKSLAKSSETVSPATGITVGTTGIFVQAVGGKLMLLDATTLRKKSDTEG